MNALQRTSHLTTFPGIQSPLGLRTTHWPSTKLDDAYLSDDNTLDSISPQSVARSTTHDGEDKMEQGEVDFGALSLNDNKDEELSSNLPHVDNDDQEDHRMDQALRVLSMYEKRNPVAALNERYQKKGLNGGVKSFFQDIEHHAEKGQSMWSCEFACPLEKVTYRSHDFPGVALLSSRHSTKRLILVRQMKEVVGEYVLRYSKVLFTTKNGARRSAALSVLNADLDDSSSPTRKAAADGPDRSVASDQTCHKPKRRLPRWVTLLSELGVTSQSLEIAYYEASTQDLKPGWTGQPTYICCVMSTKVPLEVKVVGSPQPSKALALKSAVERMGQAIRLEARVANAEVHRGTNEELHRLLLCDTAMIHLAQPFPDWAIAPFQGTNRDSEYLVYLYELRFRTKEGAELVSQRSGLPDTSTTPLGVMFASHVDPPYYSNGLYESQFLIPNRGKASGTEPVFVQMKRLAALNLAEGTTKVETKLHWAKHFNRTLQAWKTYGFGRDANQPENVPYPPDPCDRTYLFVPLTRSEHRDSPSKFVDWAMLQRVWEDEKLPLFKPFERCWTSAPFLHFDLSLVCQVLGMLGLVFLVPLCYSAGKDYLRGEMAPVIGHANGWEIFLGLSLLLLSVLISLSVRMIPPVRYFSSDDLRNRFLVQVGARNAVYVALETGAHCLTARSLMCGSSGQIPSNPRKVKCTKGNLSLDLCSVTFAEYYLKKYALRLRFPTEALISASNVITHSAYDFLMDVEGHKPVHLIPELIHVLPVPRDIIYTVDKAKSFMTAIEREIEVAHLATSFSGTVSPPPANRVDDPSRLVSLLKEATTLSPKTTYQRLEFLGDAVLGYFVALNVCSLPLEMDYNEWQLALTLATRNSVLSEAALRLGIGRLLQRRQSWKSLYRRRAEKSSTSPVPLRDASTKCPMVLVSNRTLSDIVESLLAMTFLLSTEDTRNAYMVLHLLDILNLPLPITESERPRPQNKGWLKATDSCLSDPYPCETDGIWCKRLRLAKKAMGPILSQSRLLLAKVYKSHEGKKGVTRVECIRTLLVNEKYSTLLSIAVISDTHDGTGRPAHATTKVDTSWVALGGEHIAAVRLALFQLGAYSLQLGITQELFLRFPDASESDLHLLRACAMSDDAVVYIGSKSDFCLAFQLLDFGVLGRFLEAATIAESIGCKLWDAKGGWLAEGGSQEFVRRSADTARQLGREDVPDYQAAPRYVGLVGGRLHGNKTKLPESITYDMMFTMKAMIGALVLSLGFEKTWQCLMPLFDEAMLLSAQELRNDFSKTSTLVQSYPG